MDLYHATREELIALLLAERDAKDDLTRQLARVHTTLATQQTVIRQLTEQGRPVAGDRGGPDGSGGTVPRAQ